MASILVRVLKSGRARFCHPLRHRVLPVYFASFGFCVLVAVAASGQPPTRQAPPAAEVATLTPHRGYFNEPSVAINPRNPQQVVVAYQTGARIAFSDDGGTNWSAARDTMPSNYGVSGDVSVAYDNEGHAFLCYIAFDKLGTEEYWGHNATRNGVFVRRSLDGGMTWQRPAVPVVEHATKPGIPFEDKPYIVADNTKGPYAGNLYVGWTRFTLTQSEVLLARSEDDGATWSKPVRISTEAGLPRDDNGDVEGFSGVVGPDGALYVVWADGTHVVFTTSSDGGRTFAPSRGVVPIAPPYFKITDVDRTDGFPVISIDPQGGNGAGLLYLTWSDYRNGDVDVFCSTSADRGQTWMPPVRVNADPIHNGADQFFPWLAVDPVTGAANLIFYDRQDDPENSKAVVLLARSTDHGRSFINYLWMGQPFDPNNDFIGDYTGIAALGGRVYGVWTEERPASSRRKAESPLHHTVVRVGVADFSRPGNSR
ncbi:MAG TPA: sialidase family protein [Terriglobia bacterium]|nr:sialidase family protein [Terriglobia bacterium]